VAKIRNPHKAMEIVSLMKHNQELIGADGNLTEAGAKHLKQNLSIDALNKLDKIPYVWNGRYIIRQLRNKYGFA